jgi:nitrile hydratase subunit beta
MNGIHDLGGMQDMGPVVRDPDEKAFHEAWEGRVWGLLRAMGPFRAKPVPNFRYELEIIPPADYLRMSYYERFLHNLVKWLLKDGLITQAELDSGHADPGSPRYTPRLTPPMAAAQLAERTVPRRNEVQLPARYHRGEPVRARNLNPVGHTRLPRYVRGKLGTIVRVSGVFNLEDTDTEGYSLPGDNPQPVYLVRFGARELWGEQAGRRDAVLIELWEDYLERA